MSFSVAPIVEGHGDVAAVPILLRRMLSGLHVARPVRFPRSRLIQQEHLARAARIAAANIPRRGAVLLILDSDTDCAAELSSKLMRMLSSVLPGQVCRVAVAVTEFESWIVGGDSKYEITDSDRAGSLKSLIKSREGEYKETADQPRLTAKVDLDLLATRSRSFRHLQKVVDELAELARQ